MRNKHQSTRDKWITRRKHEAEKFSFPLIKTGFNLNHQKQNWLLFLKTGCLCTWERRILFGEIVRLGSFKWHIQMFNQNGKSFHGKSPQGTFEKRATPLASCLPVLIQMII